MPLCKPKSTSSDFEPPPPAATTGLREAVTLPGVELPFPVRTAKARFPTLLQMVAGGQKGAITSAGAPKAG